jgi:hypothetical protein
MAVTACESDETPKAWSALATCLAGDAATSPLAQRAEKLRLIQLANSKAAPSKDGWPERCAAQANTLFATLSTSGETAVLRGKMRDRLNCNEEKSSCAFPADSSLLSIATELWQAAEGSGLKAQVASGVTKPDVAPAPALDAKGWKSFSDKPARLSPPVLTSDNRALVVLKVGEGRAKPSACEFSSGLAKVRCVEGGADVPELPSQTIDIVNDSSGLFVAGLTETGLVAYNLANGEKSAVRGRSGQLQRDGVVVERGAKEEAPTEAPPPPPRGGKGAKGAKGAKPKGNVKEEGFVAVELARGKAGKDIPLPIKAPVGEPLSIGNQVVFLNQGEGGVELVAKVVDHGRLRDKATIKGSFAGALRSCRLGDDFAVAAYGLRSGQQNAKATGAGGKTQFSLALFQGGQWSKALETTMAFERALDSGLVCNKGGASLAWAQNSDGGAQVGRIDCSADGCKSNEVKLPGVDSKWWWAVGPIGAKVFVLWRSTLGETRLRVAALAELAQAKDTILFDSPDFGGPPAGDLNAVLIDDGALFLFKGEQPVAVHLSPDGAASVVLR